MKENNYPMDDIGKIPPQAIDIENAVIGALMIEREAFQEISEILTPECFYKPANSLIFRAIRTLYINQQPIDMLTITEQLRRDGVLEEVGGAYNIALLSSSVNSAAHLEHHARILLQKNIARELIKFSSEISVNAYDESKDVTDILAEVEQRLTEIKMDKLSRGIMSIKDVVYVARERLIELRQEREAGRKGYIPTPIKELDRVLKGGFKNKKLIIVGARPRSGKALRMDEQILTPKGWVLNKDLNIGDEISSIDGKKSFVTGVYPQGELELYEIEFMDGRKIECSADHLWQVNSCRFKEKTRTMTTEDLYAKLQLVRYKDRITIPLFCGEFGSKKEFIISPYLLGILIGDGCGDTVWAKPDLFIVDKLKSQGYNVSALTKNRFMIKRTEGKSNPILDEYRRLGLADKRSYEKFIPSEYLDTSREQRKELLNGLLDTDGYCDKNGGVQYSTSSKTLADNVVYLCRSLGYKCSLSQKKVFLNGVRHRDAYMVGIIAKEYNLFTLPRKHDREKKKRFNDLTIKSIIKTEKKAECQCISVSHPSKLFVTKDFIVTHNTQFILETAKKVSETSNNEVLLFNLEMDAEELCFRLLFEEETIDDYAVETGTFTNDELLAIETKLLQIAEMKLKIVDDEYSLMNIISKCRKEKRENPDLSAVFIDYLQLIETNMRFQTRDLEVGYITRKLKQLAKELDLPIVLLAQLNRDAKGEPALEHLRESGNIEQDADVVILLDRPTLRGVEYDPESGHSWAQAGQFIVAKHRQGVTAKVKFSHDKRFKRMFSYVNIDAQAAENYQVVNAWNNQEAKEINNSPF